MNRPAYIHYANDATMYSSQAGALNGASESSGLAQQQQHKSGRRQKTRTVVTAEDRSPPFSLSCNIRSTARGFPRVTTHRARRRNRPSTGGETAPSSTTARFRSSSRSGRRSRDFTGDQSIRGINWRLSVARRRFGRCPRTAAGTAVTRAYPTMENDKMPICGRRAEFRARNSPPYAR